MVNFYIIGLCMLAGFLLRRSGLLPVDAHKGINVWVIYLAVPAVALKYIPAIQWSNELLLPASMPLIVWGGAWLSFYIYARFRPIDTATRTALTLTAGLGNTSFLGFPLVQGYFGENALSVAVISDQASFIIMSTLGATMAMTAANSGNVNLGSVVKKLLLFPPFVAFIAALILPHFVDLTPVNPLFDRIAATLVPLALFSVGMQLSFEGWQDHLPLLSLGLGYKLLMAPAIIAGLVFVFHMLGIIPSISIFEAAMAPMITAGLIAAQYQLNPKLANLMVGIGILFSFASTGLWWLLIKLIC